MTAQRLMELGGLYEQSKNNTKMLGNLDAKVDCIDRKVVDGNLTVKVIGLSQRASNYTLILAYAATLPKSAAEWAAAKRINLGVYQTVDVLAVLAQAGNIGYFLNRLIEIAPAAQKDELIRLVLQAAEDTTVASTTAAKAKADAQAAAQKAKLDLTGVVAP